MERDELTKANKERGIRDSGFRPPYDRKFQYPSLLLFKGIPSQKITRRRGERGEVARKPSVAGASSSFRRTNTTMQSLYMGGKMNVVKLFWVLLVIIFLNIGSMNFSQSGLLMSVYGHVIDLNTNEPLTNTVVRIFQTENDKSLEAYEGVSDSTGFFEVRYLEPGEYRFFIETPDLGAIYIGNIGTYIKGNSIISTAPINDPYSFEIEDGKNLNLNIYLKDNSFPKVERKDSKIPNSIDFFMYYISNKTESKAMAVSKSGQLANENSCPGFNFYETTMNQVPDNERILLNGEECIALFGWQVNLTGVIIPCRCRNNKCEYDTNNARGNFYNQIQFHSPEWIKVTWRTHKNLELSDRCSSCINQSFVEHEKYHARLAPDIVNEEYCNLLERIKNLDICCQDVNVCISRRQQLWDETLANINNRISRETEQGAWDEFENYYTNHCCCTSNENSCSLPYPDILIKE